MTLTKEQMLIVIKVRDLMVERENMDLMTGYSFGLALIRNEEDLIKILQGEGLKNEKTRTD